MLRHNARALGRRRRSVPVVLAGNADVATRWRRCCGTAGCPCARPTTCCPTSAGWRPSRPGRRSAGLPRARDRRRRGCRRNRGCGSGWRGHAGRGIEGVSVLARPGPGPTAGGRRPRRRRGDHRRLLRAGPGRRAGHAGPRGVGVPPRRRTVEGDLGVSASVGDLRAGRRGRGTADPGDDPLDLGDGRRDGRPPPAPARRGGLRARRRRSARASGWSCSPAGSSGTPIPAGGRGGRPDRRRPGRRGRVLTDTEVLVDRRYVLAAAGLLAADHPGAAAGLVRALGGRGPRPRPGRGHRERGRPRRRRCRAPRSRRCPRRPGDDQSPARPGAGRTSAAPASRPPRGAAARPPRAPATRCGRRTTRGRRARARRTDPSPSGTPKAVRTRPATSAPIRPAPSRPARRR